MKKILTIILCSALVMISGCDKYDFCLLYTSDAADEL